MDFSRLMVVLNTDTQTYRMVMVVRFVQRILLNKMGHVSLSVIN